jgi:hypothetical protein
MRKLFIFIIFICANLSAKSQNTLDSINTKVIEILENKYLKHKKFFEIAEDTMSQTIAIKNAVVNDDFFYVFSIKKVKNHFIFISITEMNKKKNNGSYVFQDDKFFYKKEDFKVEIISEYFTKKNKDFLSYIETIK